MKIFNLLFLLLAFFSGCALDAVDTVNTKDINFSTSENSRIFFENVARASYEKETYTDSRIDVFRHTERLKDTAIPYINAAIAYNGMDKEAYIYIEPSAEIQFKDSLQVFWSDFGTRETGSFWLNPEDYRSQFIFAATLFNNLVQKHELYYKTLRHEKVPLFTDETQQKVFVQTMRDYYNLIGIM